MKILIIDDDPDLRDLTALMLRQNGFDTVAAADGEEGLRLLQSEQPNLILLDMNLPDQSGLSVLEHVRVSSAVPVIMLTVRRDDEDVVQAFDLGADDYVSKPFSNQQLVARVRAALRRVRANQPHLLQAGSLRLDLQTHEVKSAAHASVHLTALEARLLEVLMSAPGQPLTARQLIEQVWGYEARLADQDLLKSLVRRVRVKIEPDPKNPRYLKTLLGVGYVFAEGINE